MEKEKFKCPGCGHEMAMELHEFIDVTTDPVYKEKLLNGEFFKVKCPACGDETLAEYPVMYMDPDKKLTIYMAPGHEEDLLEQLNSLDIPDADVDPEAVFRLVDTCEELIEKILLADKGRDDRVIELYKAVLAENAKREWPQITADRLFYFFDEEDEFFIAFGMESGQGEELTIDIEDTIYNDLAEGYMEPLYVEPNKYAKVDSAWIAERIEVEA